MKNLTLLLAMTAFGLGALCAWEWRRLAAQQTELVALRAERDQQSQQVEDLQKARKEAEQQRAALAAQAEEARTRPPVRAPADAPSVAAPTTNPPPVAETTKADKEEGGFGKLIARMMQDPDTRNLIRDQQRTMLDQLYAPLIKQLGLNADEATAFKDLLADNMMKSTEKATSLFGGTNRAGLAASLAADQKTFEDQVKDFLGEARFAQYQDYQQTFGERSQLNLYNQQNAGALALNDVQREALLAFMKEEKQYVATATGQPLPGSGQNQANLQAMLSEDQAAKLFQSQESVNQRVYERARTILSADQLDAFARFQTNQLQMMRVGMNMARKFLSPDTSGATTTTPGQ